MLVASDGRYSRAQTLVDYDTDDDGLIEVKTPAQWRAIHYDLDTNGIPESREAPRGGTNTAWATAYPNAMTAAGCPARDHDDDPATADQASCIGYELVNDINLSGGTITLGYRSGCGTFCRKGLSGKIVGNGFRILNNRLTTTNVDDANGAMFAGIEWTGWVEGIGGINSTHGADHGRGATFAMYHEGMLLGSYALNPTLYNSGRNGGLVGEAHTHATNGFGTIAHSFSNGGRVGGDSVANGGLIGEIANVNGNNRVTCINSYFSGDVDGRTQGRQVGLLAARNGNNGRWVNCVGDTTTDSGEGGQSTTNLGTTSSGAIGATHATMAGQTGYAGPFAAWDDYPLDGTWTALDADEPRTDAWYFGDTTTLPVLKAWGHDRTLAPARSATGANTVNLCTRTLAVANEIIRQLKDNVRRSGTPAVPSSITNMQECTSSTDTRNVTITQLTDYAVTHDTHFFNLRPERTWPPQPKLTSLDPGDFAYLPNVHHFDLGNNALETLPPRLFHGIPARYVDLSNNNLTSLPADLFAGIGTVTATERNRLILHNNQLTDTGIPGRVFDTMAHLNGLDLSHNALTRVNTRWFEQLNNLGRRGSNYTHGLGLHLGGNTITEHYYSSKLFTGIREKVVSYADASGPPVVAAGDALRSAIIAAIDAATTSHANLSLSTTSYFNTLAGTTHGYAATSCGSTQNQGPGRGDYLRGLPQCRIQPHWTPPHKMGDTGIDAPAFTGDVTLGGIIYMRFNHTTNAAFSGYQMRYRTSSADPWSIWKFAPITAVAGPKSAPLTIRQGSVTYQTELRVLSTAGPPGTVSSGTAESLSRPGPTGLTATPSTTAVGSIELSWTATDLTGYPTGHNVASQHLRWKPVSQDMYTMQWQTLTAGATSHTMTGLEPGTTYDIEIVAGIAPVAGAAIDYYSGSASARAMPLTIPAGLIAVGGSAPGTIDLAWSRQTVATSAQARFQVRRKKKNENWSGISWDNVPDSDQSGNVHDETGTKLIGMEGGVLYDIQVRLIWNTSPGAQPPVSIEARATPVPTPSNFNITATPGELELRWTRQTGGTETDSIYEVRYKKTSAMWTSAGATDWVEVPSSDHSTDVAYLSGLDTGDPYNVELRFRHSVATGYSAAAAAVATPIAVAAPTNVTAEPSSTVAAVVFNWDRQTASSSPNAKYQVRARFAAPNQGNWINWIDVPDSDDAGDHAYDEAGWHMTSDLWPYRLTDFEVRLVVGSSMSPATSVSGVRPGYYPRGLQVTAGAKPGTIDVSWDEQTSYGSTNTDARFAVTWRTNPSGGWSSFTVVVDSDSDGLRGDETAYQITGLTVGTGYDVAVGFTATSSFLSAGQQAHTPRQLNIQPGTVFTPTNVAVSPSTTAVNGIDVTWDEQTLSTESASKFQYRCKPTATSAWTGINFTDVSDSDGDSNTYDETSVTVGSLTANTSYDCEVRFYWDSTYTNGSAASATGMSSTVPSPPNFNADTGAAAQSVDLSWDAMTGVSEFQYRHRLTTPSSSTWLTWTRVPEQSVPSNTNFGDETGLTVTGLDAGANYTFELRAHTATQMSTVVTDTADAQDAGPPTSVTFAQGSNAGEIDISWAAPSAGTPTGFDYRVKLTTAEWPAADPYGWMDIPAAAGVTRPNRTSYTIESLFAGEPYDVELRTETATSNSIPGDDEKATIVAQELAAPGTFTSAAGDANGEIDLSWALVQTGNLPSGDSVVRYEYRSKSSASATWGNWTQVPDSGSDGQADEDAVTATGLASYTDYDIELRAALDGDDDAGTTVVSYYSDSASLTGVRSNIHSPAGFTVTGGTAPGSVDLDWTAQPDFPSGTAVTYSYRYKPTGTADPSPWPWVTLSGTPHDRDDATLTGIPNNVQHDFQLRFSPGTGLTSVAATAQGTPTIVAAPTSFSAATSTTLPGAIDLRWDPQTAAQLDATEFQYRTKIAANPDPSPWGWQTVEDNRDEDADPDTDKHDESRWTITSLTASTGYYIELRLFASTDIGASTAVNASATSSAVSQPANLMAGGGSTPGSLDISWDLVTGATSFDYRFKLRSDAAFPLSGLTGGWTQVPEQSVPRNEDFGDEDSITITGLQGNALYDVQVRAVVQNVGMSTASEVTARATLQPPPATFNTTQGTNPGDVDLSWTAPTGGTVTRYEYRYKRTGQPDPSPWSWEQVPDSTGSTPGQADETAYTLTGLWPGVSYDIELRVVASGGNSDSRTDTLIAQELPGPTNFTAARGTNGSDIVLGWDLLTAGLITRTNSDDSVVRYEYQYKKSSDSSWENWAQVPDSAGSTTGQADEDSYTITGLDSYTQYDVGLRAVIDGDDDAATTVVSYYSETVSQTSVYSGINAPADLTVAGGTAPGSVDLSWTAQQDFDSTATITYSYRYKVAGQPDPGTWTFTNITGTAHDRAAHTVAGLTNNVEYEFQLKYNAGSGLDSGTATAQGRTTAIAAITNFRATDPGGAGGRITISWDGQSAATDSTAEFQYRVKAAGQADPGTWPWRAVPDNGDQTADPDTDRHDETTHIVTELSSGTRLSSGANYHIELRFFVSTAVGSSATVNATQTASVVPVPTGFSASAGTPSGSIDLSWTASAGATGYQYRCNPAGTSCSMTSPSSAGTGTSHTITGLTVSETYSIQIRAQTTNVGDSAWTSVQTADPQPEAAPTSFSATTGSAAGTIVLGWTAPTTMALGGTLEGFEYQYRRASLPDVPANWSGWADVPDNPDQTADPDTDRDDETAYTITSLWAGVSYVVQIRTESSIGYSNVGMSTTATATSGAVAAPASFNAAVGDMPGEIDLTWTHITTGLPDSNADAVVNYQFRTKLTSGSTWTDWTNMPTANTASYTITGLTAGTQHDIELRAAIADNDEGTATTAEYHSSSDDETGIYAGIATPDGLSATTPSSGNPGRLTVSWTAQSTFGATFTAAKYEYRYKETATANWPGTSPFGWQDVPSSDRSTDTFTISGIKGGTPFDVQVRFVPNSTIGAGAAASDDGTSRAVTAPVFTAATSTAAAGAIELSWTAQTATSGSEAKYQVRSKLASGAWPTNSPFGWTDVADTGSDGAHNENSLRLTGLTASQSYHVQLRFHWSNAVGPSVGTQRTASASAVPTPDNFGASAGTTPGSVSLSWDAVASATYQYRCSPAGTRCDTTAKPAGSGTSFTVTGLEGGETYSFQVRALVSGVTGSSPWSPVQTAQPQQEAPPRNFDADTGDNPGEIDIEWDAPNSPGGTVIGFDYRYRRASQPDVPASWTDWTDVPDSDSTPAVNPRSNEDEYTITSLWAGVSYVVQIRTESSIGHSLAGQSTTDTATSGAVAAPSGFSAAIGTTPSTINLTWTHITSGLPGSDSVVNYQFRTKLSSGSTWGNWTNMPTANTSSYTIPASHNLTAGTQYDVDLRAAIADSDEGTASTAEYQSAAASVTSIYSGIASPSPLRAITPTSGNPGRITISWTAQTTFSTGSYQYRYRTSPNAYPGTWTNVPSSDHNTDTFTISDLINGRSYDVQVRFVAGSAGTSAPSTATGNTRAIAIPTGLTAAPAAATVAAIDLSWDPQSAVTVGTAKFQYRFKRDNVAWGSQTWNDIGDSAADSDSDAHNERAFTITSGLTAGARYDIQLRLFMSTAIGSSQPRQVTASASNVPVPQSFSASTGGGAGEILISWSAVNGATGYEYRCSPANTGCDTTWKSAGTGTQFTIQNLANGEWYSLQVRATAPNNSASAATGTQRARAQTTPGPNTFTLSAGTNPGEIVLAWTPPSTVGAPVTHYEYRYKLSSRPDSAYPATYTRSPDSDSDGEYDDERTATLTGLTSGAEYDVQIRVFASSSIGYSLPLIRSRKPTPVPPPTNFREDTMATLNPGEVKLNWNAPVGVSVLRYELRHQLGTTGRWSNWEPVGTATTHTFTGLRAGQLRTFQIRTVMTTVGNSDAVSTTGTPTPVPIPMNFTASTGTYPGEIDIEWDAVTGATSYEYRVRLSTVTGAWPDDAWVSVAATPTETVITGLSQDSTMAVPINYSVQLRAVIRNVGESDPDDASAAPRSKTITDATDAESLGSEYKIIEDVPEFLIIEIPPSRVSDTFIYRYREANPGLWSRWFKVTPSTRTEPTRHWIRGLMPNTVYEVEIRAYRIPPQGMTEAFTAARSQTRTPVQLDPPEGFEADESSGIILLTWASPARYIPIRYEYSYRKAGETEWSDWIEAPHVGDVGADQSRWVSDLDRGFRYDFRLRTVTVAGATEPSGTYGTARVNVAEVVRIQPTVRSVNVRAGDQIALTVDIYDAQEVLDNSIFGREGNRLFICWEQIDSDAAVPAPDAEAEACVPGGSMFGTPNNGRRVTYAVPDTPGVYTVRAEPQPDGICTSHHEGADEITQAERDACTATFTIRVSAAPTVTAPRPDPVDPRSIPTSLTDDDGQSYAVFTPAAGGTYTSEQITVTAPAGAIPDRTFLGIASTVSEITPPAPIPGTTLTVAGSYHEVTAITGDAEPPVPSYTLSAPVTACLPFPTEFRADLSNVVVVQRKPDGNLTLLSSKVRLTNSEFQVCGTLSTLPATLGVARVGTVPQPAPDRESGTTPGIEPPDTGAATPGYALLAMMLVLGTILVTARLTGMHRISRM